MPDRWNNVWLRASLIHPVLFVAPLVSLCLLLAELPGSDVKHVGWGFLAIPLSAIASFITTVRMAIHRPLSVGERVLVVLVGLIATGVAVVLGFYGWLHAAEVACHGGYECPF
ncbi:MAG: hypothetical protein ABUM26_02395 [Solirubrobacterales bacterium]